MCAVGGVSAGTDIVSLMHLSQETRVGALPPALAIAACTVPPLLAINYTPSATLFNQLLAVAGWGGLLIAAASLAPRLHLKTSPASSALGLMALLALSSPWLNALPWSLALSSAALLLSAFAVLSMACALPTASKRMWLKALLWSLMLAGLLSALIGLVQVFAPDLADGKWIARSSIPGRAVGNMRQPNHLASLLIWACVAAVTLAEIRVWNSRTRHMLVSAAVLQLLVLATVLTASRTGMLAVFMLAAWGLLDRKLSRLTRRLLLLCPVMLALAWMLVSAWANLGQHAFGADARLAEGPGSPSRLAIMANSWALLKQYPWTGVGWGEFNLAWSMTPFPDRPVAFFDHCHNLPLQILVEIGWPLGLTVLALLGWAIWRVFAESRHASGNDAVLLRSAFMLLMTIGLHSLLEYPLWYAYFLLPTAFALGLGRGWRDALPSRSRMPAALVQLAGLAMLLGSAYVVRDYMSVVAVYAPPADAEPLEQRIRRAQQSTFFAVQADYAAATSAPPGTAALAATRRAAHQLVDIRLMMAWANSLHAVGEIDQARYVAERLREFHSVQGDDWLQLCGADKPEAFQCQSASRSYEFKALR